MILSFRTDMPGQTVQTQIRLLLEEEQIRVYTVCHSVCSVWTHYSMVEPHSSNFRLISTNFLGVRIFRKFTILVVIRFLYWACFSCVGYWIPIFHSSRLPLVSILMSSLKVRAQMSHVTRKPVFGFSDQARLKPACSDTETS